MILWKQMPGPCLRLGMRGPSPAGYVDHVNANQSLLIALLSRHVSTFYSNFHPSHGSPRLLYHFPLSLAFSRPKAVNSATLCFLRFNCNSKTFTNASKNIVVLKARC
ncbi:hypothetical protein VNO78_34054 [Psophocarpus tetragonolobus]|uniref:Uncharacterized protein n=1 Tax=Psophocarpus tetragonolobus TaxID=3891 RepID=A0AAN9RQ22_PSOTE